MGWFSAIILYSFIHWGAYFLLRILAVKGDQFITFVVSTEYAKKKTETEGQLEQARDMIDQLSTQLERSTVEVSLCCKVINSLQKESGNLREQCHGELSVLMGVLESAIQSDNVQTIEGKFKYLAEYMKDMKLVKRNHSDEVGEASETFTEGGDDAEQAGA